MVTDDADTTAAADEAAEPQQGQHSQHSQRKGSAYYVRARGLTYHDIERRRSCFWGPRHRGPTHDSSAGRAMMEGVGC